MLVLVVAVAQNEAVFHPNQAAVQLPAGLPEGYAEVFAFGVGVEYVGRCAVPARIMARWKAASKIAGIPGRPCRRSGSSCHWIPRS